MKMIILGAGASYDSIFTDDNANEEESAYYSDFLNWRPPLGKDLFSYNHEFDSIIKSFPGAESFQSEISACDDIEELFQNKYELSKQRNGINIHLQIINVQFYLQALFEAISRRYIKFAPSNYDILVRKAYEYYIKTDEQILFVTFNYDTLLEKSIEKICNFKIEGMEDYIKHPLKIIKPHGSWNWFRKTKVIDDLGRALISQGSFSRYLYDPTHLQTSLNMIDSLLEDFYLLNLTFDQLGMQHTNFLLFPQIIIPLRTKDDFVLPQSHLEELWKFLEGVNEILIIGWKANEAHFHKMMKERIKSKQVKILYVCGNDKSLESRINDIAEKVDFVRFAKTRLINERPVTMGSFSSYAREFIQSPEYKFF